jgi:hypothetical protein
MSPRNAHRVVVLKLWWCDVMYQSCRYDRMQVRDFNVIVDITQ